MARSLRVRGRAYASATVAFGYKLLRVAIMGVLLSDGVSAFNVQAWLLWSMHEIVIHGTHRSLIPLHITK